jgi:cell division FtsZ-interacting protein ZapD
MKYIGAFIGKSIEKAMPSATSTLVEIIERGDAKSQLIKALARKIRAQIAVMMLFIARNEGS